MADGKPAPYVYSGTGFTSAVADGNDMNV